MNKDTNGRMYLDPEWVALITEAQDIGLCVSEIRNFFVQAMASRNPPEQTSKEVSPTNAFL